MSEEQPNKKPRLSDLIEEKTARLKEQRNKLISESFWTKVLAKLNDGKSTIIGEIPVDSDFDVDYVTLNSPFDLTGLELKKVIRTDYDDGDYYAVAYFEKTKGTE